MTDAQLSDKFRMLAAEVLATDQSERLLALASPPVGGTPEQFAAHIQGEIDKWARVIRAANIKAE